MPIERLRSPETQKRYERHFIRLIQNASSEVDKRLAQIALTFHSFSTLQIGDFAEYGRWYNKPRITIALLAQDFAQAPNSVGEVLQKLGLDREGTASRVQFSTVSEESQYGFCWELLAPYYPYQATKKWIPPTRCTSVSGEVLLILHPENNGGEVRKAFGGSDKSSGLYVLSQENHRLVEFLEKGSQWMKRLIETRQAAA